MADNKDKKVLNVPALRFPEFTDEWMPKTINDLATVLGGGTPDTTIKSYWDGNIQWFTPSEIGKSKYVSLSSRTITEDGLNNSSAKLLPSYTILLSSRATVGECSITLHECATNQGFQSLIAKNCDIDFLYYLIQTKKKDLIRKACGSTFLEISANEVRKIRTNVPSNTEQKKIGALLSLIDKRIETQNKIIEDLRLLRDAIMVEHYRKCNKSELFIYNIGEPFNVMNLSKDDLTKDGSPCIIYGELFTTYGCVIENVVSHTRKSPNSTLSTKGDLLFPASTTVDALSLIAPSSINEDDIILGGDMFGIHVNEQYNSNYLSYYFNIIGKKNLAKYAKGSTIIHLHYADIKKEKITIPNKNEQEAVANLLLKVEHKLNIEQKMLINYLNIKNFLLRQMFI